jgi:membrane associated rhomboid family serine protease
MLPIGDEQNGRTLSPAVNTTLIAINVVVFLIEMAIASGVVPGSLDAFFATWGMIPAEVAQRHDLYTIVTSQFLHAGWLHLGGNMLFLWVFGDNVEDAMGHVRYLIFYLLCGSVAALAQLISSPTSTIVLVGASGAISGVLGAYIVLFPQGRVRTLIFLGIFATVMLVPAWIVLGLWFVLQLVSGIGTISAPGADVGGVAFWAHVGGFVAGVILVWLFRDSGAVERQRAARAGNAAWQRTSTWRAPR